MIDILGRIISGTRHTAESVVPTRISGERPTRRELHFRYSDGPAIHFSEKTLGELRDNAVEKNLFKGTWQILRASWEPINYLVNQASQGKHASDQSPKNVDEVLADLLRVGTAGRLKRLFAGNHKITAEAILDLINGKVKIETKQEQAGVKLIEELTKLSEYKVSIPFKRRGKEQGAWQMGGGNSEQLYLLAMKNGNVYLCFGDIRKGANNWIYGWKGMAWNNATLDDIY